MSTTKTARPLHEIAEDILRAWREEKTSSHTTYAARPYVMAMRELRTIDDNYGMDSARSVVAYALSNLSSWRGENARRLKAELKAIK